MPIHSLSKCTPNGGLGPCQCHPPNLATTPICSPAMLLPNMTQLKLVSNMYQLANMLSSPALPCTQAIHPVLIKLPIANPTQGCHGMSPHMLPTAHTWLATCQAMTMVQHIYKANIMIPSQPIRASMHQRGAAQPVAAQNSLSTWHASIMPMVCVAGLGTRCHCMQPTIPRIKDVTRGNHPSTGKTLPKEIRTANLHKKTEKASNIELTLFSRIFVPTRRQWCPSLVLSNNVLLSEYAAYLLIFLTFQVSLIF
jgi:hypothetical protein